MTGKLAIVMGDKTSHNGKVLEGSATTAINNKPLARVGDKVHCPVHGDTKITEGSSFHFNEGKAIAFDGCQTSCGATLEAGGQTFYFINENPSAEDLKYLALTIYGEARGENDASKRAVAWVIRNRKTSGRFGNSYKKVVTAKAQFSCWNQHDPNYQQIMDPGGQGERDQKAWEKAQAIAREVNDASEDANPLPGVTNYFSGAPNPHLPWERDYFNLPGVKNFNFVRAN